MTWPPHQMTWRDMTCHVATNHSSSPHVTSQPTNHITSSHPASNFLTSKQVTSPPWNSRRLVHGKEMVWASRWSVALRTFYRHILSLLYSSFFFWNFRPPLARLYYVLRKIKMDNHKCNTFPGCFDQVPRGFLWNLCQEVNGISPQVQEISSVSADGNLQILPEETSQVLEDSRLQEDGDFNNMKTQCSTFDFFFFFFCLFFLLDIDIINLLMLLLIEAWIPEHWTHSARFTIITCVSWTRNHVHKYCNTM